ncbi:hypothetical protein N9Z83_00245 [Akkermansiaceae bacterium]|nr:hypothetical protein [Akkermansiaceae bacterium]
MREELSGLLRGAPDELQKWLDNPTSSRVRLTVLIIILGFGSYGLTVGLWRAPEMGAYVAFKMPALIFITLACNGLLNGLLGLLLGSGLGFKQSLLAQLMSFAIAAMILGALAPVTFFMALNAPSADSAGAMAAHANFLVTHTALIAFAGVMANVHLARMLIATTPNARIAGMTMAAWIGGNAFMGAQFSWILRPFFGTPTIEVSLLRANPMQGTFYETVWRSLRASTGDYALTVLFFVGFILLVLHIPLLKLLNKSKKQSHE